MRKEKIFWGIFLIVGALFILAAGMGLVQGIGMWSLLWTVAFAAMLIKSLIKVNFYGIFFSIALLGIVYAEPLQITAITPWPILGAALLLGIGCSMIFPKRKHKNWGHGEWSVNIDSDGEDKVINEADGSSISCGVSFGSSVKYVNSDNFEYARFECSFGALKVYFDNAIMQKPEAVVELDNSFGGVELYVPKTWQVVDHIDNAFGGVDEKGHAQPDGRHTLYLKGDNSFGGVTIIYV